MEKGRKMDLSGRKRRRGGKWSQVEGNGKGEGNGVEWKKMEKRRKMELSEWKWRRGGKGS